MFAKVIELEKKKKGVNALKRELLTQADYAAMLKNDPSLKQAFDEKVQMRDSSTRRQSLHPLHYHDNDPRRVDFDNRFPPELPPRRKSEPSIEADLHVTDQKHTVEAEEEATGHKKPKSSENSEKVQTYEESPFGEPWAEKAKELQKKSPYGHFPSYKLRALIIKGDDDLRQEIIAMQIISRIHRIFKKAALSLYLRPYEILVTSANSGIIEFIPNTLSIDALKKKYGEPVRTLKQLYEENFSAFFEEAQKNFTESLAGYSLVSYLLQIKDRHNGNILIDSQGHLIHIDFGFMLSGSPGGIKFESAPFKITSEYVDLMGGLDSNMFMYLKILLVQGFMELRKHVDDLSILLQIMMEDSELPCFVGFNLEEFKQRFRISMTDKECWDYVDELVKESLDNWRTVQYDNFQRITNGILP
eukprot:TRINITY_DN9863_c0_g1_i1.p1 TRINITY_DN9863_c0_g1~~TRINITY_DN9863_c0_g1_i1.p1  ORF type:complete len:416 (-),score=65.38 TRINITY_DN9863_c0_g1_i1:17-1264(-)